MRKTFTIGIVLMAALAAFAATASADQGRRLSGPFCINLHTGVVRSIALTKVCRKNEVRKLGVAGALHTSGLTATTAIAGNAGANGADGASGPQGLKGDTGSKGDAGPQGLKGDTGSKGDAGPQGPKGDTGSKGDAGPQGPKGDTGSKGDAGPQGPKGDTGASGSAGPAGPAGPAGAPGLGTGTTTLCVSNGGNIKWGGDDGSLCNAGHDLVLTVVVKAPN
jgi:hypothetical protein